jgi:Cd(II)/Pb(II)-responsive transcriptional regulator
MRHSSIKIGELARLTGSQVETIRYYEREGLLPTAARSDGNYRLYDDAHVEQLQFIRHCRSLDMTLDEIRHLLAFRTEPEKNCGDVNELLDRHIGHVGSRIIELQALEKQLKKLRSLCRRTQKAKDCGILQSLSQPESTAPTNLGTHNGGCH